MTDQKLVILAHAPQAQALAEDVRAQLKALGYAVDTLPRGRRARDERIGAAHRLVVLWTRDAARAPVLRASAKRAERADKLTCVRLDDARPPGALGARAIVLPRGRRAGDVWRSLLSHAPAPAAERLATRVRTSRLSGVAAALAMALVVGAALYESDAAFAARVDQLAGVAQAQAADVVDEIKARVAR